MAPSYAIIFMDDLKEILPKDRDKKPLTWWRYINDIFVLWQHGQKKLENFLESLNCNHPIIKFIASFSREACAQPYLSPKFF